jgi:hypothetical protein
MSDDDVTALPTSGRRRSRRPTTTRPNERGRGYDDGHGDERHDHHDTRGGTGRTPAVSPLLVGSAVFLLVTATLLYGVTLALDGIRVALAGPALPPVGGASTFGAVIAVARSGSVATFSLGGLGVGYAVVRTVVASLHGR